MPLKFKITKHDFRPIEIVEVIEMRAGKESVIAVIYPQGELSINIVSAHVAGFASADGRGHQPPFPTYTFTFDPQPYVLSLNQVIRMSALGID